MRHQTRKCTDPVCGLRFPTPAGTQLGARCPHCGAPTTLEDAPYDTHEVTRETATSGLRVEALLDNLRSVRNVGSIFRTADGAGVAHLHLGGFTPTPEHRQMGKTALGAETSVPWTLHRDPIAAAESLRHAGATLWALEGGAQTCSLLELLPEARALDRGPLVLVLGHEVSGVDPRLVERCHRVVHLPMAGIKGSLNVSVAFGVAAYLLCHAGTLAGVAGQGEDRDEAQP